MAFAAGGSAEPGRKRRGAGKICRPQRTPVVDFRGPAFASDRDTFLRQMGGQVGAVVERRDIAVAEGEFEAAAVLAVDIARDGADGDDRAAGEEAQEIHEVAGLADDASPALLRVERPMVGGQSAGVDVEIKL